MRSDRERVSDARACVRRDVGNYRSGSGNYRTVKVVDSLSPCFRGDFPESVTADRYVTSECEDP